MESHFIGGNVERRGYGSSGVPVRNVPDGKRPPHPPHTTPLTRPPLDDHPEMKAVSAVAH